MKNPMLDNDLRTSARLHGQRPAARQAARGAAMAAQTPTGRCHPLPGRIGAFTAPPAAFRGAPCPVPWPHPFGRAWRVLASRKTSPAARRLGLHAPAP